MLSFSLIYAENAVFWPSCLSPVENGAPALPASPAGTVTLDACFAGCKTEATCKFWSYSLASEVCTFHTILFTSPGAAETYEFVSGEKYCGSAIGKSE